MKPGCVRCPACGRPVKLGQGGRMFDHYASLGRVGTGFRGLSQLCRASRKRPEDVK